MGFPLSLKSITSDKMFPLRFRFRMEDSRRGRAQTSFPARRAREKRAEKGERPDSVLVGADCGTSAGRAVPSQGLGMVGAQRTALKVLALRLRSSHGLIVGDLEA